MLLLLLAFFVGGTALLILNNYRNVSALTVNRAVMASEVVSTNVDWVMEIAHQILRTADVLANAQLEFPAEAAALRLTEMTERLPGAPKIYIVRHDGRTTLTTDREFRDVDIRDREYFKAVAGGKATYVSSLLQSRLNNEQIFVISRRIEREGRFAGAAMISFNAGFMQKIWASLSLDPTSTVSLVRDDGQLVLRYPQAAGPLDLSQYVLFTDYLKRSPSGYYDAISPADQVERVVAYRRAGDSGLIALSSMGREVALADFRRSTYATLAIATPVGMALLVGAFLTINWLRRDREQRRRLAAALEANQMLFREIHHRVKNNLQAVASLINLQKLDPDAKRDMMQRIQAMVAVHEHIYRNDEFANVDASIYLPTIVQKMLETFGGNVKLDLHAEPMIVDRESALPLGLITNEVVSNALKYAFVNGREGRLQFELRKADDNTGILKINDNGDGFDPKTIAKGMGSRLVAGLSSQIRGEHSYTFDKGTTFKLKFPLVPAPTN